ncbi:MAG: response regulator [Lachnospiraceae bacterium]|nr:response regulator [Lachnospiraceae bacterium]MBQ2316629.1 response regulator [Lachnospiraceae bacterium]MBQ5386953.1 response regulator [Lachnospiraceae bacterium]
MNNNVILIGDHKSFMVTAIVKELEQNGYNVLQTELDVAEMNKYHVDMGVFVLYLDSPEEHEQELLYLKNRITEQHLSLVVIGKHLELERLYSIIPMNILAGSFVRPVNIKELGDNLDEIQKQGVNREQKKRILLVDDDGTMLRTMKAWLEDHYQVYMVNSGMAAISFLMKNEVDLILLDYEMPVTNGPQVLEMLHQDPDLAHIPVMFLTVKADKDSVLKGLALGPESYLLKTMPRPQLLAAINEFFVKQRVKDMQQ